MPAAAAGTPGTPSAPAAHPWRIALIVLVAVMLGWDAFKVWVRPSAETWATSASISRCSRPWARLGGGATSRALRAAARWTTVAVLGVLTTLTILGWRLVG
jgi:hypothetical protein